MQVEEAGREKDERIQESGVEMDDAADATEVGNETHATKPLDLRADEEQYADEKNPSDEEVDQKVDDMDIVTEYEGTISPEGNPAEGISSDRADKLRNNIETSTESSRKGQADYETTVANDEDEESLAEDAEEDTPEENLESVHKYSKEDLPELKGFRKAEKGTPKEPNGIRTITLTLNN